MSRKLHKIDAADKVLGRLASEIATLLRGKNKATFTPHIDDGDIVEIANVDKIKLTGKKMEQKLYYWHSGFPGGIKSVSAKVLRETTPNDILIRAVYKMLPRNSFRDTMIKRLHFVK